jgi:hypothetical protein
MLFDDASQQNYEALVEVLREGAVTAFLGAGLSAGSQPDWAQFHSFLQRQAGVPARPFDAELVLIDLMSFRDALGPERYLGIMRAQFGGSVAEAAESYRLVDELYGVRHLITTNWDENLAAVASANNRVPDIAAEGLSKHNFPFR